jgi:beta-N-acetylhexosaminidase
VKIGSFFIAGFSGTKTPEWLKTAILQHDLFGVILFARNLSNAEQVRILCEELQTLKKQVSQDPLLIGLDHEGGFVTRANTLIPGFPPAWAQCKGGTPETTRIFFKRASLAMRTLGINCNFAPVLDLLPKKGSSFLGLRSFSSDPKMVLSFGAAALQGMNDAGILACGKHFPGLGSAKLDSHDTLPTISKSKKNLTTHDLLPFQKLIARIPLLMTAHAFYPALETEKIPATFSKKINRDLLRGAMHFKGLLVSDDLCMGAVTERFSYPEAVLRAVTCGIDLTLLCHAEEKLLSIFKRLQEDFLKKIPDFFLVESVERKRALYEQLKKFARIPCILKPDSSFEKTFLNARRSIANHVFKVVQKSSPLFSESILVLTLPGWIPKGVEETPPALTLFFQKLQTHFPDSELRVLKTPKDMVKFLKEKTKKSVLLLAKDLDAAQHSFVDTLVRDSGKIACALCVKNPEDARFLKPFANTVVCTFGFDEENWDAVVDFFTK